jgi:hypothetical protein
MTVWGMRIAWEATAMDQPAWQTDGNRHVRQEGGL